MNKLNIAVPIMYMMMMIMIMMITWINFHPMHMIMMLILYSIIISVNLSLLKKTFLYSIMLLLIMISGILIIFLYFSSLISNEKIKLMNIQKSIYMILMTLLSTLILLKFKFYEQPVMKSMEVTHLNHIQNMSFNNLEMLYTYPFNSMSILCMMFLLLSMLSIIKIISIKSSPLRKIM
nr:TPA_asm: NADH dehydrogenase subunit 6 [Pseudomyrmex ferrugineus]